MGWVLSFEAMNFQQFPDCYLVILTKAAFIDYLERAGISTLSRSILRVQ